jgi:pimeloyl-ACP methyl ester carboxylesterase
LRPDGRKYSARMRTPVAVPVLQVNGAQDAAVSPTATTPPRLVTAPLRHELITPAGHFPHEEAPDLFNSLVVDWLRSFRD